MRGVPMGGHEADYWISAVWRPRRLVNFRFFGGCNRKRQPTDPSRCAERAIDPMMNFFPGRRGTVRPTGLIRLLSPKFPAHHVAPVQLLAFCRVTVASLNAIAESSPVRLLVICE